MSDDDDFDLVIRRALHERARKRASSATITQTLAERQVAVAREKQQEAERAVKEAEKAAAKARRERYAAEKEYSQEIANLNEAEDRARLTKGAVA